MALLESSSLSTGLNKFVPPIFPKVRQGELDFRLSRSMSQSQLGIDLLKRAMASGLCTMEPNIFAMSGGGSGQGFFLHMKAGELDFTSRSRACHWQPPNTPLAQSIIPLETCLRTTCCLFVSKNPAAHGGHNLVLRISLLGSDQSSNAPPAKSPKAA